MYININSFNIKMYFLIQMNYISTEKYNRQIFYSASKINYIISDITFLRKLLFKIYYRISTLFEKNI